MEAKASTDDIVAKASMEEAALSARTEREEWEAFRLEASVMSEAALQLEAAAMLVVEAAVMLVVGAAVMLVAEAAVTTEH